MVNISLRVLSRPDARTLPMMYRQLGIDYDERVLPSICNEASYTVSVFTVKRSVVYGFMFRVREQCEILTTDSGNPGTGLLWVSTSLA